MSLCCQTFPKAYLCPWIKSCFHFAGGWGWEQHGFKHFCLLILLKCVSPGRNPNLAGFTLVWVWPQFSSSQYFAWPCQSGEPNSLSWPKIIKRQRQVLKVLSWDDDLNYHALLGSLRNRPLSDHFWALASMPEIWGEGKDVSAFLISFFLH